MDQVTAIATSNPYILYGLPVGIVLLIIIIFATHKKHPQVNEAETKDAVLNTATWKPESPEAIAKSVSTDPQPEPVPQNGEGGVVSTEVVDPIPAKIEDVQPKTTE